MALNSAAGGPPPPASNKLGDFAQALYQLLIPNADDHGRMSGDAVTVKLSVFPSSPHPVEHFEAALIAMHEVGLILRYEVDGDSHIEITHFRREQPGIKSIAKSRHPDPPPEVSGNGTKIVILELPQNQQLAGNHRKSPEVAGTRPIRTESNRIESKGKEQNTQSVCEVMDLDALFEVVWSAYPKQVEKPAARQEFLRLRPTRVTVDAMLKAIDQQKLSRKWKTDSGRYIPHLERWIKNRQWEDALPPAELSVEEKNACVLNELKEEKRRGTA